MLILGNERNQNSFYTHACILPTLNSLRFPNKIVQNFVRIYLSLAKMFAEKSIQNRFTSRFLALYSIDG